MAKTRTNLSYLFLYDPTRLISDEIHDRFKNILKYKIESCIDHDSLLKTVEAAPKSNNITKICIYVMNGMTESEEGLNNLKDLISSLSSINDNLSFICLLNKPEKEEKKYTYPLSCITVQNNDNVILRITNHVLGIISKENLDRKYFAAKRAVQLFLAFLLFFILIAAVSYFVFPQYF